MKKILLSAMISCSLIFSICHTAAAEQPTSDTQTETEARILPEDKVSTEDIAIYSKACCVMDAQSGQVLYYKNPADRHYPASITKVLTALVLIENAGLQDKITFSEECWEGIDRFSDMNVAMEPGEVLTVEQALYCMMLVSANEVCNQAGIFVSGSIDEYTKLMTKRAREMGCSGSNFTTTNGLHDENHYTTAFDMAIISRAAILNDTFRKIDGTNFYNVTTDMRPEGFELYHKHRLLAATDIHDDRCIGGKTGYTPAANNTLVTYMESGDLTLVCVVLDNSDGHIYSDTLKVCDYCFEKYDKAKVEELSLSQEGEAMNAAGYSADAPSEPESSDSISSKESSDGADAGPAQESQLLTLNERSGSSPRGFVGGLGDKLVSSFINNIPYSFMILVAGFIALTLLLIWLKGIVHRGRHRHRYKKRRKSRL